MVRKTLLLMIETIFIKINIISRSLHACNIVKFHN